MTGRINTEGQTPVWAGQMVVEAFYPGLTPADLVLEPSCGYGSILRAIPNAVPAAGVEINPLKAEIARRRTGRPVTTGDFRTATITVQPSIILGNPPFVAEVFQGFLRRCHDLLPTGGEAGFILPAYFFQTAGSVVDMTEDWSIRQDMIPRNIFGHLHLPLVFARFTKDRFRRLIGFALYGETVAVLHLPAEYRALMTLSPRPLWRSLVETALQRLGGEAALADIYREIEGVARHRGNRFWREKLRQVLQMHFRRVAPGVWGLPDARVAA